MSLNCSCRLLMSSDIAICDMLTLSTDALILSTVACSTRMSAVSAASPAGERSASCEIGASALLWSFSWVWSSSRRYRMRVSFCKHEGKGGQEGGKTKKNRDQSASLLPQIGKHAGKKRLTCSPSAHLPTSEPFQEPWFRRKHEAVLHSTAPKTVHQERSWDTSLSCHLVKELLDHLV